MAVFLILGHLYIYRNISECAVETYLLSKKKKKLIYLMTNKLWSFFATWDILISLRVEVSFFVLSPEIEDRDEVEVDNWAKHKKTCYSE
jgi:hypothetical protein